MDYPVIIAGEPVGSLSARSDGLFTVFEARIPAQREIVRLWVFGQGRRAYLGVMQPGEGGFYLRRRLTAEAMRGFPKPIEYAGTKARDSAAEPTGQKEPTAAERDERELLWFATPGGVLNAFDGSHSLTAIPVALRRPSPGADIRNIGGRDYIVFRKH